MKKSIVLDLDQTLISAEATEDHDFNKYKKKSKSFDFHNMDGYYIVYCRPGLQEFLDYIFANFNVSVWTAASKDYAVFIIDKILIGNRNSRKLDYILFSYHCDISKKKKGSSKDLSLLWDTFQLPGYDKDNTVILDDFKEVIQTQPDKCIAALPFEFTKENSEHDKFLNDLIPQLEKLKNNEISPKDINKVS